MFMANVTPSPPGSEMLEYGALGVLVILGLAGLRFLERMWDSRRLETPILPNHATGRTTNGGKTTLQAVHMNKMEMALAQLQEDTTQVKKTIDQLKEDQRVNNELQNVLLQGILDELKQLNRKNG